MNNEHTKMYIQIGAGIIGIGVVIGGAYLLVRGELVNAPTHTETEEETSIDMLEEMPLKDSSIINADPSATTSQRETGITTTDTENKTQYDQAIQHARDAFFAKNYSSALAFYEEAKTYEDSETVYAGMSDVYLAMGEIDKARTALDMAIEKNPSRTEHWRWKLMLLDERFNLSFAELNTVYEQGLQASDPNTKVNLVVVFATIATERGEKEKAIELWNYAAELYPANATVYHKEADSLK